MPKRIVGVILLALGLGASYLFLVKPLEDAAAHAPRISIYLKGALLCPIIVIFGLLMVILGEKSESVLGSRHQSKPLGIVVGVIAVALGGLAYFWLKGQLEGYGYHFS